MILFSALLVGPLAVMPASSRDVTNFDSEMRIGSLTLANNGGLVMIDEDCSLDSEVDDLNAVKRTDHEQLLKNNKEIAVACDGILSKGTNSVLRKSGTITLQGEDATAIRKQSAYGQTIDTGLLSAENGRDVLGDSRSQPVVQWVGSRIFGAFNLGGSERNVKVSGGPIDSSVLATKGVEDINVAYRIAEFVKNAGDTGMVTIVDPTVPTARNDAFALRKVGTFQNVNARTGANTLGACNSLVGSSFSHGEDSGTLAYDKSFPEVGSGYEAVLRARQAGTVGGVSKNGQTETVIDSTGKTARSPFDGVCVGPMQGQFVVSTTLLAGADSNDSELQMVDNCAGYNTFMGRLEGNVFSAGTEVVPFSFLVSGLKLQPVVIETYTANSFDAYTEEGTANAQLAIESRTAKTFNTLGLLEKHAAVYGINIAFRVDFDMQLSQQDGIVADLGDGSQGFSAANRDTAMVDFFDARATIAQPDMLRLTGDVEFGYADKEEQQPAANRIARFSF